MIDIANYNDIERPHGLWFLKDDVFFYYKGYFHNGKELGYWLDNTILDDKSVIFYIN